MHSEAILRSDRPIRIAKTCAAPYTSYPTAPATVFPFVFLDADYTETGGNQTLSETERSASSQGVVFNLGNQYLAEGTRIDVWQDRGKWYTMVGIPDAMFVIVSARDAFDTSNATFTGDVVWRPTGTTDPDPTSAGLSIGNPVSAWYGDAGSYWFCVRQTAADDFIAVVPFTCPNTEYEY